MRSGSAKKLSLQWRITLTTALLVCVTCVLMSCLIGYSGMRYMESIGNSLAAYSDIDKGEPDSFDPESVGPNQALTIIVSDAQQSFGTTNWLITVVVTLFGGVLAYFVSGRALRPLRDFASQVEAVQPNNLGEMKICEDVLPEFKRLSASFNNMIDRLDQGFNAQKQFTGNAAHELRTPLALMQAQIELFSLEHPGAAPETSDFLKLLQEQTERMSQMTKTLLEMSELRSVPCDDRIELAPLCEEVFTDLAPLAEQRGIALTCTGDAVVIGSDTLMYRLVFNLVENALRYSRSGTAVSVSVCDEPLRILLRVHDNGAGIPEQHKESVFQPFFRVDMSRSREHGGVGLGLSLVGEIAALHGGAVEIEESTNEGTIMLVTLPKSDPLCERSAPSTWRPCSGTSREISGSRDLR